MSDKFPWCLQHRDRAAGNAPAGLGARKQMLAAGIIDEEVLRRWEAALSLLDASPARPTIFAPLFTAIGQRTA